jgi:hypothetical protein
LGVYLAFYVLGHMDSVFIFARTYLDIDTDWDFATGAPAGLIKDSWNIRLVPHYWLGAFFVLTHLAAGARVVIMAHGVSSTFADRFMVGGAVIAGLVACVECASSSSEPSLERAHRNGRVSSPYDDAPHKEYQQNAACRDEIVHSTAPRWLGHSR